jgi:Cu/Ag efflux pump CusA
MLSALIRFSLTQRLFILLLVALTAGLGTRAFLNLPIDAFPDVSNTQVKIIIKAPGMTPEEIEQRITAPVEVEMLGIPEHAALGGQVRPDGNHHRLCRGHRHLLGPPAGLRTPRRRLGRSAA